MTCPCKKNQSQCKKECRKARTCSSGKFQCNNVACANDAVTCNLVCCDKKKSLSVRQIPRRNPNDCVCFNGHFEHPKPLF